MQRILLLVAVACVIAACETADRPPATANASSDTIGVRAAIDSLAEKVGRANETGDAELYASAWAIDGIMSAPGSPPVHGRDSIVAVFRSRPPLPPGATMAIYPTETQVINAEWAYVMGVDTFTHTPPGSAAPMKEAFTFLVVVRKTAEGWQTYREVLTAN